MQTRISALTFDFWNTLYSADGGAMDKVRPRRVEALRQMLEACGVRPGDEELQEAYRSAFDAYVAAWTGGSHFGAPHQVRHILGHFALDPDSVDADLTAQTVLEIESAAYLAPFTLLPGAAETIPSLAAAGCQLGIISDTSLTPGRILRTFLEKDGLLVHFGALTFSDETGYSKPDRRMFAVTLAELGAEPAEAMHVGDTPRTDIAGAKAMGMLAVRCAGAVDHQEPPDADYVISDHREIPAILERLS